MKRVRDFLSLSILTIAILCVSTISEAAPRAQTAIKPLQPVDYVNPMIGTNGHGHTYPGASVPFGMVQLSPDAGIFDWDWCSGYHYSDSILVGFSNTHLSGTGCSDLADILFMPTIGMPNPDYLTRSRFSHTQEHAEPGYYAAKLLTYGIDAELTATKRAGFHRYTFPRSDSACIVVDLGYGNDDTPLETTLMIESSTEISGSRLSAGWARQQYIFFVAEFSKPCARTILITNGKAASDATTTQGRTSKVMLLFSTAGGEQLLAKVGISAVSVDGARRNLAAEIPDWNFDGIRQAARTSWEKELSVFDVQDHRQADKETFYTALYHTMLAPTLFCDVDGQYRGGDGKVHQGRGFENYCTFSLWDTYRAAHPLYTIIQSQRVPDFVNSMLAFYRDSGLLPVWPLTGNETWCMIGYHSVPVITDAYLKGFTGFDAEEALTAMKKSATQNKRGLEFYNLVTPRPLDEKLAELRSEQINTIAGTDTVLQYGVPVLKGWIKTVSGEPISYHSSYPHVTPAVISRATTGEMAVEWQAESFPLFKRATPITYMWAAGLATGKGGHRFDLFANGEKWLSFTAARDTSQKQWSVRAANGAELTFVPQRRDRYDDLFGNMFLTIPSVLQEPGQPLTLRVVGENGGSSDWYMTFEHEIKEDVRAEPEYALAKEGNQQYQFLKVIVEHPARPVAADIALDGRAVQQVNVKTGVNTIEIPIAAVQHATTMKVSVNAGGAIVEKELSLPPIVPYDYIPADKERESVSKTLEYAYDDWCIAQMAKALGKHDDEEAFTQRSTYYRNLFDSTSGFMRGRNSDGSWVTPFDPRFGTGKQPQYTEGNAWQYSWYVPQNVPDLISLMGGKVKFAARLDTLFHQSSDLEGTGAVPDVTGLVGLYAQGNEPSHHIAYLYNYAGQPWKTQEIVHRICRDYYTNKTDGLCGNEDCGQMSAWYIFSAMGFYPVNPADGTYQLGTPLLDRVSIHLEDGKIFTVIAKNISDKNFYVQSVMLNDKPYNKTFIMHKDILNGGTLQFTMGPKPNRHRGAEPEAGR
jgi:putative alpha-1,2-mannosidase